MNYVNNESDKDILMTNETLTITDALEGSAFIGLYDFDNIMESINSQFIDYVNNEDKTDYVDIFYSQLEMSHKVIIVGDDEHPVEKNEILEDIYQRFISNITKLFEDRLSITITSIENSEDNRQNSEYIIRSLYKLFILNAKSVFKKVICADIMNDISFINITDEDKLLNEINSIMHRYSPLLSYITPTKFLEYIGDDDVKQLFDNNDVSGNILRKYTPKLYENEELSIEIITDIILMYQFKNDMSNIVNITTDTNVFDIT